MAATAPSGDSLRRPASGGGRFDDPLTLVAEMTRGFAGCGDFEAVVRDGLRWVTEHMGAEASSIFLLEPRADGAPPDVVCRACVGPVDITGLRLPWGAGIVGRCIERGASRMVRDAAADPDFRGGQVEAATGFVTRSILVAPLTVGAERLGAIEIINKQRPESGAGALFSERDAGLLEAMSGAAALAISNMRLAARLVDRERLARELDLAAGIQRGLLPSGSEESFPAHGLNKPMREVSGDFFDVVTLPDGRLWVAVADVSGKGMTAALLMVKTASLFRCLCKEAPDPGRLLARISDEVCETASQGMFVTMVVALYDPATGEVCLANAGHEPPLLHDPVSGTFEEIMAGAPPLGIAAGLLGPLGCPEDRIVLTSGQALYLFTDGLTEAVDAAGGMLGAEGVRRLIGTVAALPPGRRPAALAARTLEEGWRLRDDLTIMVLAHA
jgi:sigma-B regulation protein RsbU (phosphoserine phosphatase)